MESRPSRATASLPPARPPALPARAQTCGVHVWFVAHPRQLREWKGQPPNLYDISGSAHFINKADNGIVVHRNRDPDAPNTFEVGPWRLSVGHGEYSYTAKAGGEAGAGCACVQAKWYVCSVACARVCVCVFVGG